MSVHAAGFDHRAYVLFAVVTHAAVGYALATVLTDEPAIAGVIGGVLPDVDLLFAPGWEFPLVHRGLTHTPLFAGVVVGVLLASGRSRWAARGAALGLGSHLLLDTLTRSGVPWLYPLRSSGFAVDLSVHAPENAAVVWAVLLAVLALNRRRESVSDPES